MRRVLRLTNSVQRWYRSWPHWLQDAYAVLSYANFLELLPTLAAIVLAPRHFFRRLPLVLKRRRAAYQTPVKFFIHFATLFLAIFFLRHGDLRQVFSESEALWMMPMLIPLTPPAMAVIGIACYLLYQLPRLTPNGSEFPQPNPHGFRMVVSPRAVLQLSGSRFFWGLVYISVYFVAAWQIAQIGIVVGIFATGALFETFDDQQIVPRAIVLILSVVVMTGMVHWLVFRPYAEMFRASLKRPTRLVFEQDAYELQSVVEEMLRQLGATDTAPMLETKLPLMEAASAELFAAMHRQESDFDFTPRLREQRWQVMQKNLQLEAVERAVQESKHLSDGARQRYEELLTELRGCEPGEALMRRAA